MTVKRTNNAKSRGGEQKTAQPFTLPTATNGTDTSDWLRLPKPKDRLWGMSRTTWNELCETGAVKSITLRKKHAQRGIKLIFRPSAEAYLKGLLEGTEAQS
jgi:hypothetical protein